MVSRRNYISIAIMILILIFMFQFTGVMKGTLNEYGVNEYVESTKNSSIKEANIYKPSGNDIGTLASEGKEYVIYIGASNYECGRVVSWWCTYNKRGFVSYSSLSKCEISDVYKPEAVIIDGEHITKSDINILYRFTERGINLIFTKMPNKLQIIQNQKLRDILGIKDIVKDRVKIKGLHLFSGFLLGGEAIYEAKDKEEEKKKQDIDLYTPWYITGEGTKTYVMGTVEQEEGLSEEEKIKNETLPAIIWRNSINKSEVFCVNGDYLSDMQGMGIMTAMMSEMKGYELYPVVNAQNFIVAGYPCFADENYDVINEKYSQSLRAVLREIIWPALAALANESGDKLSLMMTPQFDYNDNNEPLAKDAVYYLKLLKEEYGEAGVSLDCVSNTKVGEKLKEDGYFWKIGTGDYIFQSYYTSDSKRLAEFTNSEMLLNKYASNIKTIIYGKKDSRDPIISYTGNAERGITKQGITSDGINHTFTDDFMLKSLETALGYSNIVLDLRKVAYPIDEGKLWEKLSKDITSTIATYWKPFEGFDSTVASESDLRIRRFLALDFKKTVSESGISFDIKGFEDSAWFILKLSDREVTKINGGNFKEIEKDVYLIEAKKKHVDIQWRAKSENNLYFY